MLVLLDGETVMADLRRGAIQRITDDLFLLKTIVLTNQRLILVKKRLGSFEKKYIFLKDVSSLESKQNLRIGGLIVGAAFLLFGAIAFLHGMTGEGVQAVFGLLFAVSGTVVLLSARTNALMISTVTENIIFDLEKKISTTLVDRFVDLVSREIAKQKHVVKGHPDSRS